MLKPSTVLQFRPCGGTVSSHHQLKALALKARPPKFGLPLVRSRPRAGQIGEDAEKRASRHRHVRRELSEQSPSLQWQFERSGMPQAASCASTHGIIPDDYLLASHRRWPCAAYTSVRIRLLVRLPAEPVAPTSTVSMSFTSGRLQADCTASRHYEVVFLCCLDQ
jgi:hypothetical protein